MNTKSKDQQLNEAICNAVITLRKSERGQRVLRDLRTMLDNGAYGLDSKNGVALCILVEAVRVGKGGAVSEELEAV